MKEADETDRESGYVVLPDEIEGKTISWHYAKDMRSVGIFVLGIVAAALMLVLEKQNEIQKRRHADISWQWIIRNLSVHLHCIWEPESTKARTIGIFDKMDSKNAQTNAP